MSVYAPNVARVMQKRGLLGSGSVLVSQSITTPGAGTFTVPAGVTSLTIEVWGSGASGSPSGSPTTPGGGGGSSWSGGALSGGGGDGKLKFSW